MKKVLSIISVVAVAAVLTLNVTLSKDSKTGNVNLAGISAAPEASAECLTNHYGWNHGKCSFTNRCYYYVDYDYECDETVGF